VIRKTQKRNLLGDDKMFHIEETFLELIKAVESSKPVKLDSRGFWSFDQGLISSISFRFFPSRHLQAIAEACIQNFKRVERIPFNPDKYSDVEHMSYLVVSQYVEKKLRRLHNSRDLLRKLMRHRVGFQHRFGGRHGGAARLLMGYVEYRLLFEMAARWKKQQPTFRLNFLTQHDQNQLKFAAQYPLFVDLVLEYSSLREKFFRWVLQCGNPVNVFIEFPGITDQVIEADLSNRLGRVGDQIRLERINGEKHVTLKFEGRRESILDPEKVIEFQGGYRLTIGDIFETFSRKFYQVGNLEVFQDGIMNWNTFQLGHWDESLQDYMMIDVIQDEWWKDLPHFETITKREAEERYGRAIPYHQWVVAAHATRGQMNLSYEETHAFVQVAIPNDDHTYNIYDFGKYGLFFPKNFLDILRLFTQTMPAGVMYPDDNVYYLQRQHGYYPVMMAPEEGAAFMDNIRKEVMNSLAGQRVYQIETENCARWTYELLADVVGEERLPNLYRMQLIDCEPGGPIQVLFNLIKWLPKRFHAYVLTRLHYLLGAWRGIWIQKSTGHVWRSVSTHEFFDTGEVYLPALVIHKSLHGLFDISVADLNNRTTWRYLCEKVFYRTALRAQAIGELADGLARHLLILHRETILSISLDRDKRRLHKLLTRLQVDHAK